MIRFERFTKRYDRRVAVERLDLEVGRGEVVALLGPNGSGKTTSLKAAVGLVRPSAGRVLIGGRPATEAGARRCVSFMPQKAAFPEALSGREVVEFYRRLRGLDVARTDRALAFASLNGASRRPVSTYSGGMVQRLGLAVAILPDSDVLLLDEPTAALDPEGQTAFHTLIEDRRAAGRSVLFASHQLGDAERLADRFAVLVDGRLVAELDQRSLAERLASRGVMRVSLSGPRDAVLDRVRTFSPSASWSGGDLLVPGTPEARAAALEAVRSAGGRVTALSTSEGALDQLYRELVEVNR